MSTLRIESGGICWANLIPFFIKVKRETLEGNLNSYVHYDNHVNLNYCQFVRHNSNCIFLVCSLNE